MSSLKCLLKKFEKQDKISKEDLDEIFNQLDGHDKAIREKTIDELETRLKSCFHCERYMCGIAFDVECDDCVDYVLNMKDLSEIIFEIKGGEEK